MNTVEGTGITEGIFARPDKALSGLARSFMLKSKDITHDLLHIERLHKINYRFQIESLNPKAIHFNQRVMRPAIDWHDIWKSRRKPDGMLSFLYGELAEAYGSRNIFLKHARDFGLEKTIQEKVAYVIETHTSFQIRQPTTLEALLLRDIDTLDMVNYARVMDASKIFPVIKKGKNIAIEHVLGIKESIFNFAWSKQEFSRLRQNFIQELKENHYS